MRRKGIKILMYKLYVLNELQPTWRLIDKKEEEHPKENKSNMSQKDAEQKLQALLQKEKNLQDKMHKVDAATNNKADKDW